MSTILGNFIANRPCEAFNYIVVVWLVTQICSGQTILEKEEVGYLIKFLTVP